MFNALQRYATTFIVGFLLGLFSMYAVSVREPASDTLPPAITSVPTHTITVQAKAQDKKTLRKAGAIGKKAEHDPGKEVLGTGVVTDDSGTRIIAAVIDTKTGSTALEVHRQLSEWMNRHEIGLGGTTGTIGTGGVLSYRGTFGRATSLYGDVRVDVWKWQFGPRLDYGHKYDGQVSALATVRF